MSKRIRNQSFGQPHQLRSAPVRLPHHPAIVQQEVYDFGDGEGFSLFGEPFCCNRRLSLSIKAVLRSASFARSSVEADDKLPTGHCPKPIFLPVLQGIRVIRG